MSAHTDQSATSREYELGWQAGVAAVRSMHDRDMEMRDRTYIAICSCPGLPAAAEICGTCGAWKGTRAAPGEVQS